MLRKSCSTIYDPYARVCVPNEVKYMNVKASKLMSGVNKARFLVQGESCECKCWLDESVCNGCIMNDSIHHKAKIES